MEINSTKHQKSFILCSAFIAGAGTFLSGFNVYFLVASLILLFFLFWKNFTSFSLFNLNRFLFICIAVYLSAIIYTDFRTPESDDLYALSPAKFDLKGRVISEPESNLKNRTKFNFKVNYLKKNNEWMPVKAKTLVSIYDNRRKFEIIKIGDILEINGSVKRPFKVTNPGQFNYANYLKNKGIFSLTYVGYKNYKIIEHPKFGVWFFTQKLNKIKNKIIAVHRKNLESPKLEILGGMVFGNYTVPAPKDVENDFIKSGLLHLLAASGLNVA
ncbi:MAG: DUF4131 domain-containing protein, partial [Candidatus Aenigmarchaeota archaeon]|nr:DUF4131 domain-containing protein [Candidatus Aenigmarchaeota archaeon]